MIFKTIVRNFGQFVPIKQKSDQNSKQIKNLIKNKKIIQLCNQLMGSPELELLKNIFKANGFELRMAGGAVRDLLSGIQPKDIDFASNATTDQMKQLMRDRQDVWLINTPMTQNHGTVMARVFDKYVFEITSLRPLPADRQQTLGFTDVWKIDAFNRDLTINAMYLGFDRSLYDYFDGLKDLENKVIRFVDQSEDTTRRDFRKIFRYFRFHALFGEKHDSNVLSTIQSNSSVLSQIKGQSVWFQLQKILVLKECAEVIDVMFNDIKIGRYLGFEDNETQDQTFSGDLQEFHSVLTKLKSGVSSGLIEGWEASTLLTALFIDDNQFRRVAKCLELSSFERNLIQYIRENRNTFSDKCLFELQKEIVLTQPENQKNVQKILIECSKYCGLFTQIKSLSEPKLTEFPFTGHLFSGRVKSPKQLRNSLNELKIFWLKSGFKCTEAELRLELDNILRNIENN